MSHWNPTEQDILWMQAKAYGRPARVGADLTGKVDVAAELSIIDMLPAIPSIPLVKLPSIPSIDDIKNKITSAVSSGDVGNLPIIATATGTIAGLVSASKSFLENAEEIAGKFSEVKGAITSVISKVTDAVAALGGDSDSTPDSPPPPPPSKSEPEKPKGFKMVSNLSRQREAMGLSDVAITQVDESKEAVQKHIDDLKRRGGNPAAIAKLEAFLKSTSTTKSEARSSTQNITVGQTEKQFPWVPVVGVAALAGLAIWKFWWKPS